MLQILSHSKAPVVGVKLKAKAEKPKISASPHRLNLGKVHIGSSSTTKNITIKNNGASNLVFSSIVMVNDPDNEFIYSTLCSTLKKNETCNIEVTFEPFVVGSRNAQIEIQSNDPDNSPLLLMLKGKAQ